MSIWDDPELLPSDNFLKLENEGDSFEGKIKALRTKTWDDGSKCPEILLVQPDGSEATWSAGQVQAKRKLAELRPEVGDTIRVVYTRQERRTGGKTLKHLDIQVDRNGAAVKPAPGGAGAPGGVPAGVDVAAWNSLDPAARDALLARMGVSMAPAGQSTTPPF